MHRTGLSPLSPSQERALARLLPVLARRGSGALVGHAGTGKTTTLRRLIGEARLCGLTRVVLLGPTWRSLRVALQAIGEDLPHATVAGVLAARPSVDPETGAVVFRAKGDADTVAAHRALRGGTDLLIAEEGSMINLAAGQALRQAAAALNAGLLLVGDPGQLPPVSQGSRFVGGVTPSALLDPALDEVAELTEVHRFGGALIALSEAVRTRPFVRDAWPRETRLDDPADPAASSGVLVYPDEARWLDAAAAVLCSDRFQEDPAAGRLLAWSNQCADRYARELRRRQWGPTADDFWREGEWLGAPNGLATPGSALGRPLAPAQTELRVVSAEPTRLVRDGGTFTWRTPARGFERELVLRAEADVVAVELLEPLRGLRHRLYVERPGSTDWAGQVRALRRSVKDHLSGADRRAAMEALADLGSWVATTRPLLAGTIHSAQGGQYREIWVSGDVHWQKGPEARPLIYVAVTRAERRAHLIQLHRD